MAAYRFIKKGKSRKKAIRRIFGISLLCLGLVFGLYFFFPMLSYQVFMAGAFESSNYTSPIPQHLTVNKSNIGSLIAQGFSSLTTDYTDARNWYPNLKVDHPQVDSYLLTIPKLSIKNALVSAVDYDLTQHLVQYGGTAAPGQNGTAVIFGHSTLPQLFNPKNYKTIFATAHKLKTGDIIKANVKGVEYVYRIFSITITDPEDTNMFSQSYDNSYITLVTCTPPGTIWKRLVIRASLEAPGKRVSGTNHGPLSI